MARLPPKVMATTTSRVERSMCGASMTRQTVRSSQPEQGKRLACSHIEALCRRLDDLSGGDDTVSRQVCAS